MKYEYIPSGIVCTKKIEFELDEENKVHNVKFYRGCPGNLLAIAKHVEGMDKDRVIEILLGNECGGKKTSCADQFAKALKEI